MKRISIALVVAILIAAQLLTIVSAAAPNSKVESISWGCGGRYVVQYGDYLLRIAQMCGTSVGAIIAQNPQIYNPHWIYAGMVLNLSGSGYVAPNYQPNPFYYNPRPKPAVYYNSNPWYGGYYYPGKWWYSGYYNPGQSYGNSYYNRYIFYPRVSVSTCWAKAGDSVTVSVSGFPANTDIDYRIGEEGSNSNKVYDGKTDSHGYTSQTVSIPSSAKKGESWVVHVLTTEGNNAVQAYSSPIHITG